MSKDWENHISRLRNQISELRQTLRVIKDSADDRPGLEETTVQLRELAEKNDSKLALFQLPKILQAILKNPQVGAIIYGPSGEHLLFNSAAEKILGSDLMADAQSEKSAGNFGFYLTDKITRCSKEHLPWHQSIQGNAPPEVDLFVRRQGYVDGLWVRITSTPLKSEDDDIGGVVIFLADITEQVQVETQIQSLCEALEQQVTSIGSAQLELKLLTDKLEKLSWPAASTSAAAAPNTVAPPAISPVAHTKAEERKPAATSSHKTAAEEKKPLDKKEDEKKPQSKTEPAEEKKITEPAQEKKIDLATAKVEAMKPAPVESKPAPPQKKAEESKKSAAEILVEQMNAELSAVASESDKEETAKGTETIQESFEPDINPALAAPAAAPEPPPAAPVDSGAAAPLSVTAPAESATAQTAPAVPADEVSRAASAKAKKILIVDDIPVNQKLLRLQLKRLGFECDSANNGDVAQKAIAAGDFALVLMDLDMPVMDGFESTIAIRRAEQGTGRHVPIVAMTSYDREEDRERCLMVGMDDFLSKGATQKQLKEVVERCIQMPAPDPAVLWGEIQAINAAAPVAQAPHATHEVKESALDIASLQKQFDKEEVQDVSRLFLSAVNTFIDCIQLGIEEKDAGAVTHFAHSVKGPCAALGIEEMTRLTSEIMSDAESGNWTQVRVKYMKLKSSFGEVRDQLRELCRPDYLLTT